MRIYALVGFAAEDNHGSVLAMDLTQRRILEAFVYEDGVARSAEEIRRRAQLADANTIGQGLSRLRSAWTKSIGSVARDVLPEARASKGYRLQLARSDVDLWHLEDLQRALRDRLATAESTDDWVEITAILHEAEVIWELADKRNREKPSALIESASDLGKRVTQLQIRRFENRKRWAEGALRNGKRADLVVLVLTSWLNDTESPSRADISLWRLWIEAKAEIPGSSANDLDSIVHDASSAGHDVAVLEAVRRSAAMRLAPMPDAISLSDPDTSTTGSGLRRVEAKVVSPSDNEGHLFIDLTTAPTRPPIAGLELNIRSAFVGRAKERDELVRSGVQSLRDKTGHLVTITGEPGVGKSRLVAEVISNIDANVENDGIAVSWYVGRCLPQGRGLTCWALGEIVKSIANVRPQDAPEIAIAKLEECLANTSLSANELPELVRHLSPLVGGTGGASTSDTERFFAWGRALGAIGDSQPIGLVFEDLHWADDMLLEFLDSFTEQGSPSSLFVMATARPEFYQRVNGWAGAGRSASTISLTRLADNETERMLQNFRTANNEALRHDLQHAIVDRCGGNPLFAEELARMVEQSGGGPEAIHGLPRLVELVVAARLDHLSQTAAAVAYAAATIGRVFWSGAIESVTDLSATDLRNALAELVRADLVQRSWSSSIHGQLEYTFWHTIVRDVAASRLPEKQIPSVHLRMANWIRNVGSGRPADSAVQLAAHYAIAFDHISPSERSLESIEDAVEAFQLAGQQVLLLDRVRAGEYYSRALSLALPNSPKRASLLADNATCNMGFLTFVLGEQLCRDALSELEDRDDDDAKFARFRILGALGMTVSLRGDLDGAIKILEESVSGLAQGPADEYMERKSFFVFLLYAKGYTKRALELLPEVWPWCREAVESGRTTDTALATVQAYLVDPEATITWFEQLLDNPSSPLHSSLVIPGNLAQLKAGITGPRASLDLLEAALQKTATRPHTVSVWIRSTKILLHHELGELSRARQEIEITEPAARALSPMFLMDLLGQKVFNQLLATGTADASDVDELDEILTMLPGSVEMILGALRGSAFAHLRDGNWPKVQQAVEGATRLFECNTDFVTSQYSVNRLAMLRLAMLLGSGELVNRIAQTSNPLSPAHRAERIAIGGYLASVNGDYRAAATQLNDAATQFEGIDLELDALWMRLHEAHFMTCSGLEREAAILSSKTLERLEGFGAVGLYSRVLDGAGADVKHNPFGC
jgi:AAA ATPase domain